MVSTSDLHLPIIGANTQIDATFLTLLLLLSKNWVGPSDYCDNLVLVLVLGFVS